MIAHSGTFVLQHWPPGGCDIYSFWKKLRQDFCQTPWIRTHTSRSSDFQFSALTTEP